MKRVKYAISVSTVETVDTEKEKIKTAVRLRESFIVIGGVRISLAHLYKEHKLFCESDTELEKIASELLAELRGTETVKVTKSTTKPAKSRAKALKGAIRRSDGALFIPANPKMAWGL